MNHKRGKPKNSRAGCYVGQFHKMNGVNKERFGFTGFGKLRAAFHSAMDLKHESL